MNHSNGEPNDQKPTAASEPIPVKVVDISLSTFGFVIFLKNPSEDRTLPIFIGVPEAQAIAVQFNKLKTPRPLTHDLFKNILTLVDCDIVKIVVSDLIDNTYYARIYFRIKENKFQVDSRPSDAIALALHFDAPIVVMPHVMEEGAIPIKEGNLQGDPVPEKTKFERMQEDLKRAVAEERYEDAARLRDELKKYTDGN